MTDDMAIKGGTDDLERGLAFCRKGDLKAGIEVFKKIIHTDIEVRGYISWAFYRLGDNDTARTYLNGYIEKCPGDSRAWLLMAKIDIAEQNVKDAEKHARKCIMLKPDEAYIWFEVGAIFDYVGCPRDAADAYGECLKIDTGNSEAKLRRERILRHEGLKRFRFLAKSRFLRSAFSWFLGSGLVQEFIEVSMGIPLDDRCRRKLMNYGNGVYGDFYTPCSTELLGVSARSDKPLLMQWLESLHLKGAIHKTLEIGLQSGDVAKCLTDAGYHVISVTSSEFARRDRERRGISALRTDLHLIRKPGASFDLLVADFAIHHTPTPLIALWEWKRLLRSDGYLVIMAHLALDQPFTIKESTEHSDWAIIQNNKMPLRRHYSYGAPGQVMTLSYWQLRWLFKQVKFQLLAETLEDLDHRCLESTEHVDGRTPLQPDKAWNAYFLLRKPGALPFDNSLEKPRRIHPQNLRTD